MTVNIPRHVFGCRRGYRTLGVSSDVSRGEKNELETFSFGQTSAPTYLDSLELKPAYWCRCLGSKRWAITRILKGATDDQGRSTLLFVSALLEPDDWVEKLGADSAALLETPRIWAWDGNPVLEPVKIALGNRESQTPDSAQRARVLSMLALVEAKHGRPNETIVATEIEFSPGDVRLLATLLPRACKASFSWAVRSLSEGLPVVVNSLAGNASRGTATRKITRWSRSVSYDQPAYTAALAFFWKPGQPPPWEFVANCESFGKESWERSPGQATAAGVSFAARTDHGRRSRGRPVWKRWYVGLATILLFVVAATAVVVVRVREAKVRERGIELNKQKKQETLEGNAKSLKAAVTTFIESNSPSPLPKNLAERGALMREGERFGEELAELIKRFPTDELSDASGSVEEWLRIAHEADPEHAEIERRLQEVTNFAEAEGLRNFTPDSPYPTAGTLNKADQIEEHLASVVKTATVIARLYAEDVQRTREQLAAFRDTCAAIDQSCAGRLQGLRKYFDRDLPTKLSNDLINEEIPKKLEVLEDLKRQMENVLQENKPGVTTFSKDSLDEVVGLVDEWNARIVDLRGRFDESYNKASGFIRDHMLDLPDINAFDVPQRWGHARTSLELCRRALAIWPDHAECVKHEETIKGWLGQAASVAFEHFKNLVEHAERVWRSEEKEAKRTLREPSPAYALTRVEEALAYREKIPDAVDQGDTTGTYYERAIQLQALLKPMSKKGDEDGDPGG